MSGQLDMFPSGIGRLQFDRLADCVGRASRLAPADLLREAESHLSRARTASRTNSMVNVRLAEAIVSRFQTVVDRWRDMSVNERSWLGGAILYFTTPHDVEADFISPIGFEDDTEVLNACLRLAHLDELCLQPENYDDV